nr:hypothetical protein [Tanacetum cinerariifolium]
MWLYYPEINTPCVSAAVGSGDGYGGDTRLLSRGRGGGGSGDGVVSVVVAVGWGLGGVGGA